MKTGSKIKSLAYLLTAAVGMMMSSCNGVIYDNEGDCAIHYLVRFKYDCNMKFADAFAAEVKEVTLYLVDADKKIVWQKTESGARLAEEDYAMEVDAAPGTYSMLAWCSTEKPTSFRIGDDGTRDGLTVTFDTDRYADGTHHISDRIDDLFHGYMADVNFPVADEGTFIYTLPLTKDTNHFVITLQQLNGEPIDKDLVAFEITDDNATLDWDNAPLTGTPVTYHPWYKETVNADFGAQSVRANDSFAGVIAELTTSRLMENSTARLHIYRTDTGDTIASIRLIDALLLVMGYENSKKLTKHQYLDYKDEYSLTFFLDENHRWLNSVILIESWRVVYHEHELD